jgi:hypothetical protein
MRRDYTVVTRKMKLLKRKRLPEGSDYTVVTTLPSPLFQHDMLASRNGSSEPPAAPAKSMRRTDLKIFQFAVTGPFDIREALGVYLLTY